MNRLVIIGNGFDLAHGLKTSYANFIEWYWKQRLSGLNTELQNISSDVLCSMEILPGSGHKSWKEYSFLESYFREQICSEEPLAAWNFINNLRNKPYYFKISLSLFLQNISKSIETKGWVDIENEYYNLLEVYSLKQYDEENIRQLNEQLQYLKELLTIYLKTINEQNISVNEGIKKKIYAPIKEEEWAIEARDLFNKYIDWCNKQDDNFWSDQLRRYDINPVSSGLNTEPNQYKDDPEGFGRYPTAYMLPESIMLLDFNYTKTVRAYLKDSDVFSHIQIHGCLEKPETMIFGYGDEFDDKYKKLQNLNNNDCLKNIKSVKYQESDNYRKVLSFIASEPFQVCIMGHSCGNSDRTLLNKIFEHKNCISIKPYFYIKENGTDNYTELYQDIRRDFTDMTLSRVVVKTYCEPLVPKTK